VSALQVSRRGAFLVILCSVFVLVAGGKLWWDRRAPDDLVRHRLVVSGKVEAGRVVVGVDAVVRIELVPERPHDDEVGVAAFLVQGDAARLVTGPTYRSPAGVVRIEAARSFLFPTAIAGAAELVVFVGRPGRLPRNGKDAYEERKDPSRGVQVLSTLLTLL
jgi:hypothetical protein